MFLSVRMMLGISGKNVLVVTGILFMMLLSTSVMAYENGETDPLNNDGGSEEIDPEGEANQEERSEMFGQFEVEGKKMMGGYVGFEMAPGEMLNYNLNSEGEAVFARIQFGLTAWTQTEYKLNGAVFEAEKEGAMIMSHNNPSGLLRIRSGGEMEVEIEPAEGVSFEDEGDGSYSMTGLNVQSKVQIQDAVALMDGSTLKVQMEEGSCFTYMVQNEGSESQFQNAYQKAVMDGNVDGEIQVRTGSDEDDSQHFSYMGEVDMKVSGTDEGKRVRVQVESLEKKGKVVAFRMDGEVLSGRSLGRIRVSFDGEEIAPTDDPEDVICATGDMPMYCMEKNENGQYQAMVYVPEFSTHEIEFQTVDDEESPGFALIILLIGVSLAVIVWALITRKRK